jgi:hypothetical protein
LYTEEFLEPSRPYLFYSKTLGIAVNPVIVEKVFSFVMFSQARDHRCDACGYEEEKVEYEESRLD